MKTLNSLRDKTETLMPSEEKNQQALDIHWDLPSPYILDMQVRESDIDGLGHTNNIVYVAWLERIAWAHSVSLGLDLATYQTLQRAMVVRRTEIDYLAASFLGDSVRLGTWIVECDGKLSLKRYFQACRMSDGVTLLRGSIVFVCIDLQSGKPKRMPAQFSEGYSSVVVQSGTGH